MIVFKPSPIVPTNWLVVAKTITLSQAMVLNFAEESVVIYPVMFGFLNEAKSTNQTNRVGDISVGFQEMKQEL